MKKSSVVILTIVAALTISSCAVQKTAENLGPPDPVYAEQVSDTTRSLQGQSPPYYAQPQPYNYYYRSYFWDNLYRIFCPQRYQAAISRPGYVPRRLRPVRGDLAHTSHPSRSSGRRGGFGHHGSTHAAHA
ncbi:MAG TPA: hypothetical protein VL728_05800 [Cyclobacteriaceae bacterium]|jgi:hypothetical protein|nr:hypothetical protein [Cyclobacteriaceae bacterium]